MLDLDTTISEALNKFYKTLSYTGNVPTKITTQLLLATYLRDFLEDYQGLINEEDYNAISKVLDCMYGTCYMPYSSYNKMLPAPVFYVQKYTRISEASQIRISEHEKLRELNV